MLNASLALSLMLLHVLTLSVSCSVSAAVMYLSSGFLYFIQIFTAHIQNVNEFLND